MAFCVTQDYTYVGREQADEQVSDITHHGGWDCECLGKGFEVQYERESVPTG